MTTEQRPDFAATVARHGGSLAPLSLATLQVNITKLCNQACVHCHVDASPRRREMMDDATLDQVLRVLARHPDILALDVTGGAPELHPGFVRLVKAARALGRKVMVRHNLTVTLDPHPLTGAPMEYLPEFFAEQGVEVISSLPYYQEYFTDRQRGDGVFRKSIESLKRLNARGFGVEGTGRILNLVYNPVGAFLPAPQAGLEKDYKQALAAKFGVYFNQLFAIANMPIHRFKAQLKVLKTYEEYLDKLATAFNPQAAAGVMCRSLISVGYDGRLYDCDFNQMLGMGIGSIFEFERGELLAREVKVGEHCFGCTAGAGSSCGGSTIA
jgi:radical SAM/Cys-rich protein